MTNGQESPTAGFDAFTRMWTEFANNMMSAGLSYRPESPPPEMARTMRSAMFQAMSRYAEEFMRSPQFLEFMRQSMDSAILFKKMVNDFLGRAQFEMQGVSRGDMDALVRRLRRLETRIMDRFDELNERLDALEARLGLSEGEAAGPSRGARAARPGRGKGAPAGRPSRGGEP